MGHLLLPGRRLVLVSDRDHRHVLPQDRRHAVRPSATSDDVKDVFDKASPTKDCSRPMPRCPSRCRTEARRCAPSRSPASATTSASRRCSRGRGRQPTTRRSRASSPRSRASASTTARTRIPIELLSNAGAFVIYYNDARLHMGIGFVTPAEKHDGRADGIIGARKAGLKRARGQRLQVNRGCSEESDAAKFLAGLGQRL
jgi:hypothetical protein